MKKICTLLALSASLQLSAQHTHKGNPFTLKHRTPITITTANKTTATASRLIASAGEEYMVDSAGFIYTDSAFVTYSGDRGGDLNSEYIKFDHGTLWWNTGNGLEETEKMTQTFDGNDNILSTLVEEWDGSAWANSYGRVLTYNSNNSVTSETEVEWNQGTSSWDSVYRYTYAYNTNNNLILELGQSWNGSTWENEYSYNIIVDNDGNPIVVTLSDWNGTSWDSVSKNTSTYNGDNFITSLLHQEWNGTSWENGMQVLTTYDGNNIMLTNTQQNWVSGSWVNANMQTNTVSNNNIVNELYQMWINNAWVNMSNVINTYDVNHNLTSRVNQSYMTNAFVNSQRQMLQYNSYNQVTSEKDETWINSAWASDDGDLWNRYYYEDYTITGIEDVVTAEVFNVFPVPARNYITVEKSWNELQPFSITILDINGRLVRHYSEKPAANYSRNLDVSQLPAGNYIIKVAGVKGKASYKQFNVTH